MICRRIRSPAQRGLVALVPLLVAVGLVAGCGQPSRQERPRGSAVWLPTGSSIEPADLARLDLLGAGDLYLPAARVAVDAAGFEPLELPRIGDRTFATLVIQGVLPLGSESSAAADTLRRAAEDALRRARLAGLLVRGVHLDLAVAGELELFAEAVATLSAELDQELLVSVTVGERELAEPDGLAAGRAADFAVLFVYGQRETEPLDEKRFRLDRVEERLRRLEAAGIDYLAGVSTVGRVLHLRDGSRLDASGEVALRELVDEPALEVAHGFALESPDRYSYRFTAQRRTRIGGWRIERGDELRAIGLASHHLEELSRRLGALPLEHCLGQLVYRLPTTQDRLNLSAASLIGVLSEEPVRPRLALRVEPVGGGRRVVLENLSDESTELIPLGDNYVELKIDSGSFGRVEQGDFTRWELLRPGPDGTLVRSFRDATHLRLYAPLIAGREVFESGPIELRAPAVEARGHFVLADGGILEVAVESDEPDP